MSMKDDDRPLPYYKRISARDKDVFVKQLVGGQWLLLVHRQSRLKKCLEEAYLFLLKTMSLLIMMTLLGVRRVSRLVNCGLDKDRSRQ